MQGAIKRVFERVTPAFRENAKTSKDEIDTWLEGLSDEDISQLLAGIRKINSMEIPDEFEDSATFLIQFLFDANPAIRKRFSDFALSRLPQALQTSTQETDEYTYNLLSLIAACPAEDKSLVTELLVEPVKQHTFSTRPSNHWDMHRQMLFVLQKHISEETQSLGLVDVFRADMKNPEYAGAAYGALLAYNQNEALREFPDVLRLLFQNKITTAALIPSMAVHLGKDEQAWLQVKTAIEREMTVVLENINKLQSGSQQT